MDQQKEQVNNLLEEGWFFGNTLKNRSKSSKVMVRCNSDPCTSSSTKEDTLEDHGNPSKMSKNMLLRAPSLPVSLGKDTKYGVEDDDEDDYEPRMGDLIRQAMPLPVNRRRLDRTPSLPPCRETNEASSIDLRVEDGCHDGGKSCRKVSVESSPLVQEKGPIAMVKLSRRASIDSSFLLPPKCTSKGTKSASNSKNRTPKKLDHSKIQSENTKLHKSPMDLQIEELQGDLGLSSKNNNVSPYVRQIHVGLQRRASLDSNHVVVSQLRRSSLSEPWRKPSLLSSGPPSVAIWAEQKSSQDIKAQIKFWARAVASNVRQEC